MATAAYRRFVESFFGQSPAATLEGPDVAALLSLGSLERTLAEQLLLKRLGSTDSRPAIGLGALKSTKAAARLRAILGASRPMAREISGGFLVNVAAALWQIEANPDAAAALIDVLGQSPFATLRAQAATELGKIPTKGSTAALSSALEDDSMLVRGTSASSLVHVLRLDEGLDGPHAMVVALSRANDHGARRDLAEWFRAMLAKQQFT